MTLTIEKPETEKLLRRVARSRGLAPAELIQALLEKEEQQQAHEAAFANSLARNAALLSAAKLRQVWDTPEDAAAWSHL